MNIASEVAALERLPIRELRERYVEAFGEQTPSGNKVWIVRRLAWRLQSRALGGLSERARRRAEELADEADLRTVPPKTAQTKAAPERTHTQTLPLQPDNRLPPPGTVLTRKYKGQVLQVKVLADGFEYQGSV